MRRNEESSVFELNLRARLKSSSFLTPAKEDLLDRTYDNRMYGMLNVLAGYSGVSQSLDYFIRIQHGLVDPNNLLKDFKPRIKNKIAQLIWTHAPNPREIPNIYPIGAPFLYLRASCKAFEPEKDLVVVPHGGTYNTTGPSGFPKQHRHSIVHRYLTRCAEKPAVLLYWHDFIDPEIRMSYTNDGYDVNCAGFPGLPSKKFSKNEIGGQAQFLESTQEILLKYRRLVIFEPTTTAIYAAFLGIKIYFEPESYLSQLEREIEVLPAQIRYTYMQNGIYQSSVMKSLLQPNAFETACSILGFENKKKPDELASILTRFQNT